MIPGRSAQGPAQLARSVEAVLEFYKELGFDALPFVLETRVPQDTPRISPREPERGSSPLRGIGHGPRSGTVKAGGKDSLMTALREEIGDCTRCKLSGGRTQIVFGEGSLDARLMFVGEAPGREEDLQGRPFVGEAGKILTSLITRMGEGRGFSRQDVYIANIVKCRPPMNRDPEPDEIATCLPFLNRQIEIISPDVIVCLGRISTHTLLGIRGPLGKLSITKVRGKFYDYSAGGRTIPLMPTFHPAYLLRNPKDKWLTWEDAQAVLNRLAETEKGG